MRQLVYGLEKGECIAKEFLTNRRTTSTLIDETWADAAFREAERTAKRERRHVQLGKPAKAGR